MPFCRRISPWTVVKLCGLSLLVFIVYINLKVTDPRRDPSHQTDAHHVHVRDRPNYLIFKDNGEMIQLGFNLSRRPRNNGRDLERRLVDNEDRIHASVRKDLGEKKDTDVQGQTGRDAAQKVVGRDVPVVMKAGDTKIVGQKKEVVIKPLAIVPVAKDKKMEMVPNKKESAPQTRSPGTPVPKKTSAPTLRVLGPGENLQVGQADIYLNSAVYYEHYPGNHTANVMLNGWANNRARSTFKCCFTTSLAMGAGDAFVEVPAQAYNIYKQYLVDMQSAEYFCSVPDPQYSKIAKTGLRYVTLAESSCKSATKDVLKIEYPALKAGGIGICLRVLYGSLNPEKLVEWFEYVRLMGVAKVVAYYYALEPYGLKVLEHYKQIGVLDMILTTPAKSKAGQGRSTKQSMLEKQMLVDNVMAANGCKQRMSGFDYVVVMDTDQFIIPKGKLNSYSELLAETLKRRPASSSFRFDQHVVFMNWNATRKSPLHITKHTTRTKSFSYANNVTTPCLVFKPQRTFYVGMDQVFTRTPFKFEQAPSEIYELFQYRFCNKAWRGCRETPKVTDNAMLAHETKIVDRILRLPLAALLPNNLNYVTYMKSWRQKTT
ncbi:unnamed protein product [Lymnaea stagnalis]|uniref:Glycosyltransferase family 92 protein n=1 Tax=Lymnaea stagnalis TaxID=6523 RepID=A0AAV2HGL7_LYMST